MKKLIIALVFILGVSTNSHATGNSYWTLKGFTVGKPIPENKVKKCLEVEGNVSKVCVYSMTIAGVPSSLRVFTIKKNGKDLIWGISAVFKNTNSFEAIETALKEKYGDPFEEKTNIITDSIRSTLWGDSEVFMELKKEWITLQLLILDSSLQVYRKKMQLEANKKRASDL